MNEGYIKFQPVKIGENIPNNEELQELINLRAFLKKHGLIGMLPDGIGFGNVSTRTNKGIIITASQTGNIDNVRPKDFVFVTNYDLQQNKVLFTGIHQPSSETLTHAAIYEANPKVKFIAHFHSTPIWQKLLYCNIKTNGNAPYGTIEIALEAKQFVQNTGNVTGIFALSGHCDGVVAYSDEISKLIQVISEHIN